MRFFSWQWWDWHTSDTHTHAPRAPNLGQRSIKISTKSCALPRRCNENNSNGYGMLTALPRWLPLQRMSSLWTSATRRPTSTHGKTHSPYTAHVSLYVQMLKMVLIRGNTTQNKCLVEFKLILLQRAEPVLRGQETVWLYEVNKPTLTSSFPCHIPTKKK